MNNEPTVFFVNDEIAMYHLKSFDFKTDQCNGSIVWQLIPTFTRKLILVNIMFYANKSVF